MVDSFAMTDFVTLNSVLDHIKQNKGIFCAWIIKDFINCYYKRGCKMRRNYNEIYF
jgi:hypothetical protein